MGLMHGNRIDGLTSDAPERVARWTSAIGAVLALMAAPAHAQYELGVGVGIVAPLGNARQQRSGKYEIGLTFIGPATGTIQGRLDVYHFQFRGRLLQTPAGPLLASDLGVTSASIGLHFAERGDTGPFLSIGFGLAGLALEGEANTETAPVTGAVLGTHTTLGSARIAVEFGGQIAFTQTGSGSNDTLGTLRWAFGRIRVAKLF